MTEITQVKTDNQLMAMGQDANTLAGQTVFIDYRSRKAKNTIERQSRELSKFADFLGTNSDLSTNPYDWQFVTWGLIDGFIKSLLLEGYAIGTVNLYLSTIKRYARLALRSGTLNESEYRMIMTITPYGLGEGKNLDSQREDNNIPTRISNKKEGFNVVDSATIAQLKSLCDQSPQGTRDLILLTLVFDFGLRVSEIATLKASDFNPGTGQLKVYRPKTKSYTTFTLQNGKLALFQDYFEVYQPTEYLVMGSHKSGCLTGKMSRRAIQNRFEYLCSQLGINNLSCHDARHTCATLKAKGMSTRQLMDFFGWNSEKMAIMYQKPNEGNIID